MPTDRDSSLAELVVAQPRAAAVFERLRLDYCCGGATTLVDACARRGLDPDTVVALLDALQDEPPELERLAAHDVGRASIAELCDHIVLAHHGPLRPALDRIDHLLATVVRVHGKDHPSLNDVDRLFSALRSDLQEHVNLEEDRLFPACRTLEASGDTAFDELLPQQAKRSAWVEMRLARKEQGLAEAPGKCRFQPFDRRGVEPFVAGGARGEAPEFAGVPWRGDDQRAVAGNFAW